MQTIVGAFDSSNDAQTAVDQLIAKGFDRSSIHLQAASSGTTGSSDEGFLSGVGHFFSNLFGSDKAHENYAEAVRRGSSVVSVDARTDAEVEQAKALLQGLGTVDVDARADQWKQKGWTGFDPNAKLMSDDDIAFERQSVPVVQEDLVVGKREVNVGGLRVIKRLSETPVSQIVSLRQERATIERTPVNRPATEADFANFKEGTIEVRETAEEAVVGKTARVVEEVSLGKDVTQTEQTVSDTVRHTDVQVERVPAEQSVTGVSAAGTEPAQVSPAGSVPITPKNS